MKNKSKFSEFFSSRGFYTALFTCIFAVLAVAAFVSVRNIDALTKLTTYGDDEAEKGETLQAAAQSDTPISELIAERLEKQQMESQLNETKQQIDKKVEKLESESSGFDTQKTDSATSAEQHAKPKEAEKSGETTTENAPEETDGQTAEQAADNDSAKGKPDKTEEQPARSSESASAELFPDNYDSYTAYGGDGMSWPLDGAIVMDFNNTSAVVYDKTLEQYRTNSTVSISSEVGTQVKAAADGVVKAITIHPRMGHMVVLEHGNGWETSYSQLQETILVSPGETVSSGQAIAGVASPTRFGVLLGPHLVFGIDKDGTPQNPTAVLTDANH